MIQQITVGLLVSVALVETVADTIGLPCECTVLGNDVLMSWSADSLDESVTILKRAEGLVRRYAHVHSQKSAPPQPTEAFEYLTGQGRY